jgi:hypothetical protein
MSSVSGLSKTHRIEARSRAVSAAMLGYYRNSNIHYTMGRHRWQGINHQQNAKQGEYPTQADCSSFVTWCLWNGLFIPFKTRDTVNGSNWLAGYTGTMLEHGKRVAHLSNVQRADAVIYGENGSDGAHTAIIVGRRPSDGKVMVISHGSEGGPYYIAYDYRDDIMEIRRYI